MNVFLLCGGGLLLTPAASPESLRHVDQTRVRMLEYSQANRDGKTIESRCRTARKYFSRRHTCLHVHVSGKYCTRTPLWIGDQTIHVLLNWQNEDVARINTSLFLFTSTFRTMMLEWYYGNKSVTLSMIIRIRLLNDDYCDRWFWAIICCNCNVDCYGNMNSSMLHVSLGNISVWVLIIGNYFVFEMFWLNIHRFAIATVTSLLMRFWYSSNCSIGFLNTLFPSSWRIRMNNKNILVYE